MDETQLPSLEALKAAAPKPNRKQRRKTDAVERSAKWRRLVRVSTVAAMRKHNARNAAMLAELDKYGSPLD